MRKIASAMVLVAIIAAPAQAKRERSPTWQVLRATDPVTRASTCAVVASDYYGKSRFTRTGSLYPVVEMNSSYGLLVGVSSGGRIRLPTGDILWAVDELPHREIRAAENPGAVPMPSPSADSTKTVEAVTAYAMQMAKAGVATSTMASGARAREMLDEMIAGRSLLFRAAALGAQTGLPDYSALMVGQKNEKGDVYPIALDASFRNGLRACGIIDRPG